MPKDINDQLEALKEGQEDQLKRQDKLEKQIGKLLKPLGNLADQVESLVKQQKSLGNALKAVVTNMGAYSTRAKQAAANTGAVADGMQEAAGATEELADATKKANTQAAAASRINAKNLAVINQQTEAVTELAEVEADAERDSKKNDDNKEKRRKRGEKGYGETKEQFEKLIASTKAFDKIHGHVLKVAHEHIKEFREGWGKNATGMVAVGAAAVFAAKKMGELAKQFREGMMDFAKFNVEQATFAEMDIVAPGGLKQLETMRTNLSMTTKQFSEFRGTLEEGVMSGVASLGDMENAATKLRESFGGAQLDKLKNYVDLLKEMPNLDMDLKITASLDDQAASWFALAQQGKVGQAIELQSAGLLGGVGEEKAADANVDILNQAQTTDAKIENIERGLYEWLPSWGPSFATIAEKTSSAAESLIGVAGLAVGLMTIFRKPPPNVADLAIKDNTAKIAASTAAIAAQGKGGTAANLAVKTGGRRGKGRGKGAVVGEAAAAAGSVVASAVGQVSPEAGEAAEKLGDVAETAVDLKDATGTSLKGIKQWGASLLKNTTLYEKGILKITTAGAGMAVGFALAGAASLYYGSKIQNAGQEQIDSAKRLRENFKSSGDVVEDYDRQMAIHENVLSGTTRKIGGSLLKGAGAGAAFGAAVGSVVPVIGTFAGALIGGVVGLALTFGTLSEATSEATEEQQRYGTSLAKLKPTIDAIKKANERIKIIMRSEQKQRQQSALSMQMYIKATKAITETIVAAQDEIHKFGQMKLANFDKLGGSVEDFNTTIQNSNKAIYDRFNKLAGQADKLRARMLADSNLTAEDRKNTLMMINKIELDAAQKFADAMLEMADSWTKSPVVQEMRKRMAGTEERVTAQVEAGGMAPEASGARRGEMAKQANEVLKKATEDLMKIEETRLKEIQDLIVQDDERRKSAFRKLGDIANESFGKQRVDMTEEVDKLKEELKQEMAKRKEAQTGIKGSRRVATQMKLPMDTKVIPIIDKRIEELNDEIANTFTKHAERQKKENANRVAQDKRLKVLLDKGKGQPALVQGAALEEVKKIEQQMAQEQQEQPYEVGKIILEELGQRETELKNIRDKSIKEAKKDADKIKQAEEAFAKDMETVNETKAKTRSELEDAQLNDRGALKQALGSGVLSPEEQKAVEDSLKQFGEGTRHWADLEQNIQAYITKAYKERDKNNAIETQFIAKRRERQGRIITTLGEVIKQSSYTNLQLDAVNAEFKKISEAIKDNAKNATKQLEEVGKGMKSAEALREMQRADAAATYDYATDNGAENASKKLLAVMKRNVGWNEDIKAAGKAISDSAEGTKTAIQFELNTFAKVMSTIKPEQKIDLQGITGIVKQNFDDALTVANTQLQNLVQEAADLRKRQLKSMELQGAGKTEEAKKEFTPEHRERAQVITNVDIRKNIEEQKRLLEPHKGFVEVRKYIANLEAQAGALDNAGAASGEATIGYTKTVQEAAIKVGEGQSALIDELNRLKDTFDKLDTSSLYQVSKTAKEAADSSIEFSGTLWDVKKGQEAVRDANSAVSEGISVLLRDLRKQKTLEMEAADAIIKREKSEIAGMEEGYEKRERIKRLDLFIQDKAMRFSRYQKTHNTKILESVKAITDGIKKNADLQISNLEEQKSYLTEYADTLADLGGSVGEIVKVRQQAMQVSYEELAIKRDEVKAADENIAAMKRQRESSLIAEDFADAADKAEMIAGLEKERFRLAMEYGRKEMQVRKEALGMQRDAYDKLLSKAFGALNANKGAARGIGTEALLFGGSRVVNARGMTIGGKSSTLQSRQAQIAMGATPTGLISSMPNIAGVGGKGAVASRAPTEKLENQKGGGLGGTLGVGVKPAAGLATPATQAAIIDKGIDGSQKVSSIDNTLETISGVIQDIAARFGIVARKDDRRTIRELKETRREISVDKKQLDTNKEIAKATQTNAASVEAGQPGERGAAGVAGVAGVGIAKGAKGARGAKGVGTARGGRGLTYQQQVAKNQAENAKNSEEQMVKFDAYMKKFDEQQAAEANMTDEERAAKKVQRDEFAAARKARIEKTSKETPEERMQRRLDMVNQRLQTKQAAAKKAAGGEGVETAATTKAVAAAKKPGLTYKEAVAKQKVLEAGEAGPKGAYQTMEFRYGRDEGELQELGTGKKVPVGPEFYKAAGAKGGPSGPAFMAGKTAPFGPAALTPTAGTQPVSTISANPRGAGAANAPMTLMVDLKGDVQVGFDNDMFTKKVAQIVIQTASTNPIFLQVMNKRYVSMTGH